MLELDLRGCQVTCKAKQGKKMPHTLKVTGTAGEVLIIGFQSRQQAEDWRKVWRCCSLAELCMGRRERWAGRNEAQPHGVLPKWLGMSPSIPTVPGAWFDGEQASGAAELPFSFDR